MSLPTLRRATRLGILPPFSRAISTTLILCESPGAEQIKRRLYDARPVRLVQTPLDVRGLNRRLEIRALDRNIIGVIGVWNMALRDKIRPDATSYTILLELFASYGLFDMTIKAVEDMIALGVGDKQQGLNYILESAASDEALEAKALELFKHHRCQYNATTYQHLLESWSRRDNLERALQLLGEMNQLGVAPNRECVRIVVLLAARMGMPQLAMDMAVNSMGVPDIVNDQVRMAILMAGAATLHPGVVQWAWKLVRETKALPTEALCVEVLNTAGRHGLPDLALSVLECLRESKIHIMEHHLAPLISAYVVAGQLREAFLALDKFTDLGVPILPESGSALVAFIGSSSEKLDEVWDALYQLPRPVNIAAINLIVQAAVNQLDMPRAVGIYKDLSDLEAAPNAHTFDIILAGCLGISHAELGERLYADMLARGIKPTLQTFSRLILLSLTQNTYELAFERLEEIKSRGMTPPARVYEALVQRCVQEGDPRAELALEDMTICGYDISPELRNFLLKKDSGGAGSRE